jgi:hypothetical protein
VKGPQTLVKKRRQASTRYLIEEFVQSILFDTAIEENLQRVSLHTLPALEHLSGPIEPDMPCLEFRKARECKFPRAFAQKVCSVHIGPQIVEPLTSGGMTAIRSISIESFYPARRRQKKPGTCNACGGRTFRSRGLQYGLDGPKVRVEFLRPAAFMSTAAVRLGHCAYPEPLALRDSDLVPDGLGSDLPLELGLIVNRRVRFDTC